MRIGVRNKGEGKGGGEEGEGGRCGQSKVRKNGPMRKIQDSTPNQSENQNNGPIRKYKPGLGQCVHSLPPSLCHPPLRKR